MREADDAWISVANFLEMRQFSPRNKMKIKRNLIDELKLVADVKIL